MVHDGIEAVEKSSADLISDRVEQLKAIVPEAFSEGKVDFEKLKMALGDIIDDKPERYSFTWAGKRNAIQLLQAPSHATLVPAEEESVDFAETQNIFVEGDNLEVLKLLYKSYSGRVKMIYIDPPYNTGNDFVYPDNFTDPLENYLEITGQKDSNGNLLTSNPETSGRYHSSWLSMMYPRLFLARQLLKDDGLIFVSIDDDEIYNLRLLMNEIFGEEGFICTFTWKRRQLVDNRAKTGVSVDHEYLLVYSRSLEARLRGQEKDQSRYSNPDNDPRGDWASDNLVGLATEAQRPNLHYTLVDPKTGQEYPCPEAGWRYGRTTMARLIEDNRILWPSNPVGRPRLKRFHSEIADDFTGLSSVLNTAYNTQATKELKELFDGKEVIDFPKPVEYLKLIIQQATKSNENDIVLDFFAGSCTTAQAVLELNREDDGNRHFIMVQLPEPTSNPLFPTIAEVGKERIRRVIAKMTSEEVGKLGLSTRVEPEDLGFRVFKLSPSNYKVWDYIASDLESYAAQTVLFTNPLKDGWQAGDVIWEVAFKEGYGLNSQVERMREIQENTVWRITDPDKDQSLLICLNKELAASTLSALPLSTDQIFVCLDAALDDTLAANLALQSRLKKI